VSNNSPRKARGRATVPNSPKEAHMSATKPTNAELAALVAEQAKAIAELRGQLATPAAVAEVVAPVVPIKPESASDKLKAHVESNGHLFARGGRTVWTLKALQAASQVLKTGEPTIVSLDGIGSYAKRGVSGLAIGRGDDGKSVLTQFVYTPKV
jgi:predicted RNA-binding protein YlqC (UPF0109 family)